MSSQEQEQEAYYKLKQDYTDKNNLLPGAVIGMSEAKRANTKCTACRRNGGVIFTETGDMLQAKCGADPACSLSISVKKDAQVVMIPWLLDSLRKRLEQEKTKLIQMKIQHALGSIDDDAVIGQYEASSDILRRLSAAIASVDEKWLAVTDDPVKQDTINRLKAELYVAIQEYKGNLAEFQSTSRDAFLVDALEQQTNVIAPIADGIRDAMYARSIVEYNANSGEYVLLQEPYTIKDMEVPLIPEMQELLAVS